MVRSGVSSHQKITMMKKLSLEMLRLSTNEILERSQMKMILGGQFWRCHCGDGNWFTLMTDNPDPTSETGCAEGSHCIAAEQ